jgi:hypothetical protein
MQGFFEAGRNGPQPHKFAIARNEMEEWLNQELRGLKKWVELRWDWLSECRKLAQSSLPLIKGMHDLRRGNFNQ